MKHQCPTKLRHPIWKKMKGFIFNQFLTIHYNKNIKNKLKEQNMYNKTSERFRAICKDTKYKETKIMTHIKCNSTFLQSFTMPIHIIDHKLSITIIYKITTGFCLYVHYNSITSEPIGKLLYTYL